MKISPILPQKVKNIVKGTLLSAAFLGMYAWASTEEAKEEQRMAEYEEEMRSREAFYISHTEFPLGDTKEEELENYKESVLPCRMDEAKERDSINTQNYLDYYNYNTSSDESYIEELKNYMTDSHNAVKYWYNQLEAVNRLKENKYAHPAYRSADSTFVYQQIEKEKKEMAESFMRNYNPYN